MFEGHWLCIYDPHFISRIFTYSDEEMIQSDSQAHILLSPPSSTEARGQVSDICKCLNRPVEWTVGWDKGLEDSGSRLSTNKGEDIHDPLGKSPVHQTVTQFMAAKGHRHWCQWTACISGFSATFLCWCTFPTSPEFNWKPKSCLFFLLSAPGSGMKWDSLNQFTRETPRRLSDSNLFNWLRLTRSS